MLSRAADHTYVWFFFLPFKEFCNAAKIGPWKASDCVAVPSLCRPLTPVPPFAPLLQYFALLLCIFLLEVLAGVLAYIYYQQVKPLKSTHCFKSPLTYICARWGNSPRLNPFPDLHFFFSHGLQWSCLAQFQDEKKNRKRTSINLPVPVVCNLSRKNLCCSFASYLKKQKGKSKLTLRLPTRLKKCVYKAL